MLLILMGFCPPPIILPPLAIYGLLCFGYTCAVTTSGPIPKEYFVFKSAPSYRSICKFERQLQSFRFFAEILKKCIPVFDEI